MAHLLCVFISQLSLVAKEFLIENIIVAKGPEKNNMNLLIVFVIK